LQEIEMSTNGKARTRGAKMNWFGINGGPMIIAGPCSAESSEQVMRTAKRLAVSGRVSVFRAGIWKPRTRPDSFEGVGTIGLSWLARVKETTGLLTTTEVATANHVYESLKHGVDILWIGARTTVSPFAVQEIADALRGVDVPVLVKNPINPDLGLWLGAIERISRAGVSRIGAIHRGFSTSRKSNYRNAPVWRIPTELMRQLPEIPIICDPSHIGGKREYIRPLSQKALDMAMDGLMIESHIAPQSAKSDAQQQVRPATLAMMLEQLRFPKSNGGSAIGDCTLEKLRSEIDSIDAELLNILSRRAGVSRKIASHKSRNNLTVLQISRWDEMLQARLRTATILGLDKGFIKSIYEMLHEYSIDVQNEIIS
jgi:chorismate mutase